MWMQGIKKRGMSVLQTRQWRRLVAGFILVFVVFGGAASWSGQPPPKILAIHLEQRLNDQGTGGYNRLLAAIRQQGVEFELSILPLKRWYVKSKLESEACFFPVTLNAMATYDAAYKNARFVVSQPVDQVSMRVYTAPDKPLITDFGQLKGRKVAGWKGRDYTPFIKKLNVPVDESRAESSQLQMLYAGRIDAIIGVSPDIEIAADLLHLPVPQFDEELALFDEEPAGLVCYDTPGNREFIQSFNQQLNALREKKALQTILGQYATVAN